jgi:hypothetical protein
LLLIAAPDAARARGKDILECRPVSPTRTLGVEGTSEGIQVLQARGKQWLLTTDDPAKVTKLKLLSAQGEAVDLARPQVSSELTRFVAHGKGIYAMATMRSQVRGKKQVVLVRWGSDPRPRMTALSSTDRVDAPPTAVLVNDSLTGVWAQPGQDGKSHVLAVSFDLESLELSEVRDLGLFQAGGFLEAFVHDNHVAVVYSAPNATMRVMLDTHAKVTTTAVALQRKDAGRLRGAHACGEKLWLLSETSPNEIALSTVGATGAVTQVATIPATPSAEPLPMSCIDDGVVVAHSVLNEKDGNIVLWVSAIDPAGKKRDQRIRDEKGTADTIRQLALQGENDPGGIWWTEGRGPEAKFLFRQLTCK